MSFSRCKTLNDKVEKDREWEIELELWIKRKLEQLQEAVGQAKKPKASDPPNRGARRGQICPGR